MGGSEWEGWMADMTARLKAIEGSGDIAGVMRDIGRGAKAAARGLALASADDKDRALAAMADAVRSSRAAILAANAEDIAEARNRGAAAAFVDRLAPAEKRTAARPYGIDAGAGLPDPVGT